jgi:hypothetical protein
MSLYLPQSSTLLGFIMAAVMPTVSAAVGGVLFLIFWTGSTDIAWSSIDEIGMIFALFLLYGIVFASIGCAVIGIPAHLALKRLNWTSQSAYGLSGCLSSGALAACIWFIVGKPPLYLMPEGIILASIIFGGPIASLTFWRITRPDSIDRPCQSAMKKS